MANIDNRPIELLVDGDFYCYQAASSVEHETEWEDGLWTLHAYLPDAIRKFNNSMEDLKELCYKYFKRYPKSIIVAFSSKSNFRKELYPEYKSNRAGTRKPLVYWGLVNSVIDGNITTVINNNLEGDDTLGILATDPNCQYLRVIASCDKDFKTIPAYFMDTARGTCKCYSKEEASYWHMYQTLIGDTTDGYCGCRGVGDVAARDFLETPYLLKPYEHVFTRGKRIGETETRYSKEEPKDETLWDCIVSLYESKGMTEEEALTQARCAYILHYENYDNGVIKHYVP